MSNKRKYTKEELEQIVKNSNSIKECLEKLGRNTSGDMYNFLIRNLKYYDIDYSHFLTKKELHNIARNKRGGSFGISISLDQILIENSTYTSGNSLKQKLYKAGLKSPICEECGQDENWRGKKMGMIIDHINGIHSDNRLENLRILCPNCNSITSTFAGRNIKKKIKEPILYIEKNKEKINKRIDIIKNSNIDFTKSGWGVKLGLILNISAARSRIFIKKYMPELWNISFKHIK